MDLMARIEQINKRKAEAEEIVQHVQLNGKLQQADGQIQVHYTVSNEGASAVYVLDRVIVFAAEQGFAEAQTAIIRLAAPEEPHRMVLSRGYVAPPVSFVMLELLPAARQLEPGQSLQGEARIPLPLQAWHPHEGALPLAAETTEWELRIGLLPVFCELSELQLEDGTLAQVPQGADLYRFQQWLTERLE